METLTALFLATPLFGLSLAPPEVSAATTPLFGLTVASSTELAAAADIALDEDAEGDDAGGDADDDEYTAQIRRRAELTGIHRSLGIATWASMGVTLLLGGIQYHNMYGFFAGQGDNPCVTGDAIFGQGQCTNSFLHRTSALLTTALYTATFSLSLFMPDPDASDEGDSEFASTLRLHKLLRWVHLGGMITQVVLGVLTANGGVFGLDRANDYGTLQALATVHMATGLITYGALTWAAALMVF